MLEFERLERGGNRDARGFRRGDVRGSLDVLRVARGRAHLSDHRVQDNRAREPLVGNSGEHLRVRAVLDSTPEKPRKSVRVQVGWDSNDYQLDISSNDSREEYKRMLTRNGELGITHAIFAPFNSTRRSST